ncbi:MAG: OmpA family protein [Gammaproteobacteria bacterium]
MNTQRLLGVTLALLLLAGCGGDTGIRDSDQAPVEDSVSGTSGRDGYGTGGASSQGAAGAAQFSGHPLDNPQGPLSQRVFYFGYDIDEVSANDRAALDAHARYLASNPATIVTVEGHADERGSREYNIGLAERRALNVRRFLLFQGASARQVRVVSYGEERPAALGDNESAWSLNRRVELQYPGH